MEEAEAAKQERDTKHGRLLPHVLGHLRMRALVVRPVDALLLVLLLVSLR